MILHCSIQEAIPRHTMDFALSLFSPCDIHAGGKNNGSLFLGRGGEGEAEHFHAPFAELLYSGDKIPVSHFSAVVGLTEN